MFIYLDESGDLGFNFDGKKPTTHFVIILLVVNDYHGVERVNSSVNRTLRCKFDAGKAQELKSAKSTFLVKEYFYKNLVRHLNKDEWGLYSIILNKKELLARTKDVLDIHRLYNILAHKVLEQVNFSKVYSRINLTVDRCKSKERVIFNHYLQSNLEAILPISVPLNITHNR